MSTSYKVDAFIKALAGGLPKPSATVDGFVKLYVDQNYMLFSPGSSCSFWVPVPVALIESIDHLGTRSCGAEEHEFVRLHLKVPTTPEAEAFSQLLDRASGQAATHAGMPAVPTAHAGMLTGGGETGISSPLMAVGAHSAIPQPASLALDWGYRFSGQTFGPRPAFGLPALTSGNNPGRTPQCGYMSINGSQQYFCRLVDYKWWWVGNFTQYWFNNFELCA